MPRTYNDGEVRAALKLYLAKNYEFKSEAAEEWEIARSYLSQIIKGDCPIPVWLLQILGFERINPPAYYVRAKK